MAVTREQLEKLKEPMDYKFRVQSTKYGKSTIVNYIDSRQVQDRLDEVCGPDNWQNDFKLIDGNLYGGIGINVENEGGDKWVWKWDVGTESNQDAEKGNASDSFKRAAVQWSIGRFLYSLGIITLKAVKHTNDKEYPATRDGKILWNVDELTEYCKKLKEQGILDDTKPIPVKKNDDSKPAQKKSEPKQEPVSEEEAQRKSKALIAIKSLFNGAKFTDDEVLKYIIKMYKKPSLEDLVKQSTLDQLTGIYETLKTKSDSGELKKV